MNSFPRDWRLPAGWASTDLFTFFNSQKLQHSFPSYPHPHLWRRIKKRVSEKVKTVWERLTPNMQREELDIVSHKNATNTLNGLTCYSFWLASFYDFYCVGVGLEVGWAFLGKRGAQVTERFPSALRAYTYDTPTIDCEPINEAGEESKPGIDRLLSK
jgi:hypothetical protein